VHPEHEVRPAGCSHAVTPQRPRRSGTHAGEDRHAGRPLRLPGPDPAFPAVLRWGRPDPERRRRQRPLSPPPTPASPPSPPLCQPGGDTLQHATGRLALPRPPTPTPPVPPTDPLRHRPVRPRESGHAARGLGQRAGEAQLSLKPGF